MSSCLEFEGKNVEKAISKACEKLNISRKGLKHDVISFGSTGIFGLVGAKKARIRVILPDIPPEKVSETESIKEAPETPDEETAQLSPEAPQEPELINVNSSFISNDPKTIGKDVLQRIVDLITNDAAITTEKDNADEILFRVAGGNSALLIGKRGQTLAAIQYLVEKIVKKHSDEAVRIMIDVEGYLEAKRTSLLELASRLAEKVKRTGKPATIGHMNSYDRRLVHLALKEDRDVRTKSIGDDYLRKLIILPKKKSLNHKDD